MGANATIIGEYVSSVVVNFRLQLILFADGIGSCIRAIQPWSLEVFTYVGECGLYHGTFFSGHRPNSTRILSPNRIDIKLPDMLIQTLAEMSILDFYKDNVSLVYSPSRGSSLLDAVSRSWSSRIFLIENYPSGEKSFSQIKLTRTSSVIGKPLALPTSNWYLVTLAFLTSNILLILEAQSNSSAAR